MSHQSSASPRGVTDQIEESFIAVILGLMTAITFANVIARYVFNANILWALEATSFLFAWLVLMGASYCIKRTSHLGVDVIVNGVSAGARKSLSLISAAVCIAYAFLLLKGAWDFWAPYAELQPTTGRWFPTGFADVRGQGWYEVNDIEMPGFINGLFAGVFNEGEPYEKMPRLIPYFVLPVSMALLLFRLLQASIGIWNGTRETLIVSHEAEEAVEEAAAQVAADEAAGEKPPAGAPPADPPPADAPSADTDDPKER